MAFNTTQGAQENNSGSAVNNGLRYSAENILQARFGEAGNTIKAQFKKTIQTKQYESEVVYLEAEIDIDRNLDGMDRTFISVLLQAQLEIQCYQSLFLQGRIAEDEYRRRKYAVEYSVNHLAYQYEAISGKSADDFLAFVNKQARFVG
jgi:hypothetical protein